MLPNEEPHAVAYVASGTGPYAVPFPFASAADLVVTVGGARQVRGSDYVVSGASIAFLVPPAGTVVIRRRTPASQPQGVPSAPEVEAALDRAAMVAQEQAGSRLVSVKDFGAIGDFETATGAGTDDTAAFQAALASGATSIFVPPGVYKVTESLLVPNGTTIYGAGKWSSLLWFQNPGRPGLRPVDPWATGIFRDSRFHLRDFGIAGGPDCGSYAIGQEQWGYMGDIDVVVWGGWDAMFHVSRRYAAGQGWNAWVSSTDVHAGIEGQTEFPMRKPYCSLPRSSPVSPAVPLGPVTVTVGGVPRGDFTVVGGGHVARTEPDGSTIAEHQPGVVVLSTGLEKDAEVVITCSGAPSVGIDAFRADPEHPDVHPGDCGGGVEDSDIKIRQTGSNHVTSYPARGGFFVRGWVNGCRVWVDIANITGGGDGVHLDGTYSAANDSAFSGVIQGVSGRAVYVHGMAGGSFSNLHCEGNAGPFDVVARNVTSTQFGPGLAGRTALYGCVRCVLQASVGPFVIDADCRGTSVVNSGRGDGESLTDRAPDTVTIGPCWTDGSRGAWVPSFANADGVNLLLGGDFLRWEMGRRDEDVPSNETTDWPWGASRLHPGFFARRCGEGMADPTRTANSPWCALVSSGNREGRTPEEGRANNWGYALAYRVAGPGLPEGTPITLVAKVKPKGGMKGCFYAAFTESPGTAWGSLILSSSTHPPIEVEHDFRLARLTGVVSPEMRDRGVYLSFACVDDSVEGHAEVYLSEAMVVLGHAAPWRFTHVIQPFDGTPVVLKPSGTLECWGGPPTGNDRDPWGDRPYRRGDIVWNRAPSPGATPGWICTTDGSHAVAANWVAMAPLAGELDLPDPAVRLLVEIREATLPGPGRPETYHLIVSGIGFSPGDAARIRLLRRDARGAIAGANAEDAGRVGSTTVASDGTFTWGISLSTRRVPRPARYLAVVDDQHGRSARSAPVP